MQGQDFVAIILHSLEDYVNWKILSNQFSKTFVIVIKKKLFRDFTENLPCQNLYYLYFYVMIYDEENETNTEVKEIMVLKNETKILLSDINQMKNDLQGIEIKSITGEWAPYSTVTCKNDTTNPIVDENHCELTGFYVDLINEAAKAMNFTWMSDISDDWGLKPKAIEMQKGNNSNDKINCFGTSNSSLQCQWGGIMGNVVLGNYHLSLSDWRYFYDRYHILDLAILFKNSPMAIIMIPATQSTATNEMTFLLRPFTNDVWMYSALLICLSIILIFGFNCFGYYMNNFSGIRIWIFSLWTFFTLMYAFYSGALTMFFLTEDELPFTNSRDVLKLFPDWKLIFKDGYEQNFEFPAKRVRGMN